MMSPSMYLARESLWEISKTGHTYIYKGNVAHKENRAMEVIKDFFGSIGWLIVAFVGGAFIGAPLWNWAKTKFPWNK